MKKFIFICLILVIILYFSLFTGCTIAGVELGLVGTWNGDANFSAGKVDITLKINSDDTGSLDLSGSINSSDTIIIMKSDSYEKYISFLYKSNSKLEKYSYMLTCNKLVIKSFHIPNSSESKDVFLMKQ